MGTPLKVGIIGASAERGWAKISHVPAVQGLEGLELAAVATEALGVPTWALGAVVQLWRFAMEQGGAAEDYTSVIKHIERWGGAEVRSRRASPHATAGCRSPTISEGRSAAGQLHSSQARCCSLTAVSCRSSF